jgi:hypothetical protein
MAEQAPDKEISANTQESSQTSQKPRIEMQLSEKDQWRILFSAAWTPLNCMEGQ